MQGSEKSKSEIVPLDGTPSGAAAKVTAGEPSLVFAAEVSGRKVVATPGIRVETEGAVRVRVAAKKKEPVGWGFSLK